MAKPRTRAAEDQSTADSSSIKPESTTADPAAPVTTTDSVPVVVTEQEAVQDAVAIPETAAPAVVEKDPYLKVSRAAFYQLYKKIILGRAQIYQGHAAKKILAELLELKNSEEIEALHQEIRDHVFDKA